VRDVPDEAAMALALIENIQREDLNAVEEAVALQRLQQEFGLTHEQIAEAVGKSRTTVTNIMRLLGLAPEVRDHLEARPLEMGHGRALLTLAARAAIDGRPRGARKGPHGARDRGAWCGVAAEACRAAT
jgi:ParB family chromosome partitioning protein